MVSKEKKYPAERGENGGFCNSDDSPFAIGQNQWVNLTNFRSGSTDKGVTGVLESIGGTLRLSTPSPSVSFINIGKKLAVSSVQFAFNLRNRINIIL